jgi:hypothetical protein
MVIGYSVEGRPIEVVRLGSGPRPVVIVGAIHGSEGNTEVLVNQLLRHFAATLHLLPPEVSLYFLPALNPDGLSRGERYNAHGVDLNRNWDSGDWQPDSRDSSGRVAGGGGAAPFSEPETRILAEWLLRQRDTSGQPVTALFYHSAYPPNGVVMSGSAGTSITHPFARVIGYRPSSGRWSAYPVTGTAPIWCSHHGMSCFEVELPNHRPLSDAQAQRHAAAILSVLVQGQTQPDQRCFAETGFCIAGRIREVWERSGGVAVAGLPLTRQQEQAVDGVPRQVQWFERVRLELHPEHAPPHDVVVGRLGVERLEQQGRNWWTFPKGNAETAASSPSDCRFFSETGHTVCGDILAVWQSRGMELDGRRGVSEAESLALYGLPLSEPQAETLDNGQTYTVQWFERARFELSPDASPSHVSVGLLGQEMLNHGAEGSPPPPPPPPPSSPVPAPAPGTPGEEPPPSVEWGDLPGVEARP